MVLWVVAVSSRWPREESGAASRRSSFSFSFCKPVGPGGLLPTQFLYAKALPEQEGFGVHLHPFRQRNGH